MRIKEIIVNKLFGLFDHKIPFKLADRITIMYGPNGVGKTVLLKMLNAIFNAHYRDLRQIPFKELRIEFDDRSKLTVHKSNQRAESDINDPKRIMKQELVFELSRPRSKVLSYTVKKTSRREIHFPLSIIDREINGLERIGTETWLFMPTQEKLTLDEVLDRFSNQLPLPLLKEKEKAEPEWLSEIRKAIPVRFIETQRLLTFSYSRRHRDFENPAMVPSVVNYSEELASAIQTKLAEYATLSQSLDRTFPTRLVKSASSNITLEQLRTKLAALEDKRSRLMAAGLLDKEKEIDFQELQKITETNRNVLSVYIEDVGKKLSVFDELTNKIDLLIKIINSRFLYKKLSIDKKEGFIFRNEDGDILQPSGLSSGEQHELVLLYELLFKVSRNTLILIDEPELSLHVVWQQQFLKDLKDIIDLAGFDVLIATHSPQIIHDRWDLTVELKGPQK